MNQTDELKFSFRANIPDDVLASAVKHIHGGTRDAARRICESVLEGTYTKQVARDLFPHIRRAAIESRLFTLSTEYQDVIVTSRLNKTKNHHHTLIRVGQVLMTASSVLTPYGIVREADFRNSYAAGPQMRFDIDSRSSLSVVSRDDEESIDDLLYGIILYCPADNNRFEIGSIVVGFPNHDCSRYVDRLDLLRLFPETAKKTEVELIEDQAVVDLLLDEEETMVQPDESTTGERL